MNPATLDTTILTDTVTARTAQLFQEQHQNIVKHTDWLFARLMTFQWFFGLALALWISPRTWAGAESRIHMHVWAAVLLGGGLTIVPVLLAIFRPGETLTRHVVAVGQMLMSALLIHLTGGRIETHFHVFGSLAILAFYRDWKVLISATVVVFADHIFRGFFWPESVFGVLSASIWRSFEHAGWVIFEVTFLIISIRKSLSEMHLVAERQAKLEALKEGIELTVAERTADLRRSEEQLRQSQKMEAVGRLAGGVAHDFNNLLTVIGGYCALSLPELDETDPLKKNMTEIQKAAERAKGLTGQLLAFSRKQVLQPRVLNLNEAVQGMEKMLRRLIGEDIDLSTVFESPLGRVKADPGQIEQVIMNLAVNARDAMPRGGKLTISTSNVTIDQKMHIRNRTLEAGKYVMLAISDNGMGMTEDVQSHLFEPFFTTKGLGKGTGLGLATCHGIVCQSGGDIRVYSELNSGTTFKIYLPRTDAALDAAGNNEPKLLPKGKESILVVEDEPAVRTLAVLILRQQGYQVQESNNAFEALELIRKSEPFNLVLTDVIMPQMSGKSLCDQIMSQRPYIKVLLMSGYTDDALAHHGVLDEGLSFLEKPFSPAQLTRKVRDVLDAPDLQQPVRRNGRTPELAAV
jgi:signal transduction histidine kinase/ActR/RegA family two-component response regulator